MPNSSIDGKITNEQIANVFAMSVFILFSTSNLILLINQFKISVLLNLIFNLIIVTAYIIRRPAIKTSFSKFDILVSVLGTSSGVFFIGSPYQHETLILQVMQILGLLISLSGLLFLRKSFGVIPADRGIVTNGIYRFIRHPIYAGYFLSFSGFLIQNYTMWNLGIFTCFIILETTRLLREEKLLKQNPEYLQYTQKTRWRILPYVW